MSAITACSPRTHSGCTILRRSRRARANLTVPAGSSVTFRYRFYLHDGDEKQADVAGQFDQYAAETASPEPSANK